VLSIGSKGSFLSIGSIGSALSIGSIGSFLSAFSIGSAGSLFSALSAGSRWSAMSYKSRARLPRGVRHATGAGDAESSMPIQKPTIASTSRRCSVDRRT
jgi:hypothetical protein